VATKEQSLRRPPRGALCSGAMALKSGMSCFAQIPDGQRRRLTTIDTPSQAFDLQFKLSRNPFEFPWPRPEACLGERKYHANALNQEVYPWNRAKDFPREIVTLPGETEPSSALVDACYALLLVPKSAALN
jgi:hypothetical protein